MYDVDGYSIVVSPVEMVHLQQVLDGEAIPICSIGADLAGPRGLYDPDVFALVGMSQPEVCSPQRADRRKRALAQALVRERG